MKPADFFETSHLLENGETANNNSPAIFFNGGVKMRKTAQIIAILMMLVLMFAGVSVAGIFLAERDALTELCNKSAPRESVPRLKSASTMKRTMVWPVSAWSYFQA